MKETWQILKEAGNDWMDDRATRMAAALALYTLLSTAPLVLITIGIAGAIFGHDAASGALTNQLKDLVGAAGADVVKTTLKNGQQFGAGVWATVIGVAILLYGASSVFVELQDALNTMWNVKPKPGRAVWGFIRDRLLTFGMVIGAGFLLLVSLVVTTVLQAFGNYLGSFMPDMDLLLKFANFVLSFVVIAILFAMIFKYLPDVKITWRYVWFGAVITTALFTIGKYLIGFYLGRGTVTTPFGAAGSLVAFIVWTYYSGLILYFGAELTKVTARRAGDHIEPSENATIALPGEPGLKV
jgi:membrane protein